MKFDGVVHPVTGTCGVLVNYNFKQDTYLKNNLSISSLKGGANWLLAGFVNDPGCKKQYKKLMKTFPCVYQSCVRKNKNSDNKFFFCIFDTSKENS